MPSMLENSTDEMDNNNELLVEVKPYLVRQWSVDQSQQPFHSQQLRTLSYNFAEKEGVDKKGEKNEENRINREFWDRFEAEDDDTISDHNIFYKPAECIEITIQLMLTGVLVAFTCLVLLASSYCFVLLTRPSDSKQVEKLSKVMLVAVYILVHVIPLPYWLYSVVTSGFKTPRWNLFTMMLLAACFHSCGLMLLITSLLASHDVLTSFIILAALNSLPQVLYNVLTGNSSDAKESVVHYMAPLVQIATYLVTCMSRMSSTHGASDVWLAILTMLCYTAEYVLTMKMFKKVTSRRRKASNLLTMNSMKVLLSILLTCSILDVGAVTNILEAPYYVKSSTLCLVFSPPLLYIVTTITKKCKLFKVLKASCTLIMPIAMFTVVAFSLLYSKDVCLQKSLNNQCMVEVKVSIEMKPSLLLAMLFSLWMWSYMVCVTSSDPQAESFRVHIHQYDVITGWAVDERVHAAEKVLEFSPSSCDAGNQQYSTMFTPKETVEHRRNIKPVVYLCATMWHENQTEMRQLLKSIFKLDEFQSASHPGPAPTTDKPENFDFESHIMFDDAILWTDGCMKTLNTFVQSFLTLAQEVACEIQGHECMNAMPLKFSTPYGGKLVISLPKGNKLVVHLKDKQKIRNKKRWSMIQYMYYLLGYQLLSKYPDDDGLLQCQGIPTLTGLTAENTFLLTVDGDVSFEPESVRSLLNEIRRSPKTGVVCGRIHPLGSGILVWYQRFEYAISHWLHKTAEHVMGVVLCTPGAFSLFRASALMDRNVMKTFSKETRSSWEVLQCEQGEDRWLCTLLFQQGYRCEYVPQANAQTFAPETLEEFFNQRRRWNISTIVNHLDLLLKWKSSYVKNKDISLAYVIFEAIMFLTTAVGATYVIVVLSYANMLVFGTNIELSYVISTVPPLVFALVCMIAPSSQQIRLASILVVYYSGLMVIYLFNTVMSGMEHKEFTPLSFMLLAFGCLFVISAVLHPSEMYDLLPGVLYYLLVPSTFMILMIYSVFNINNVSWGTRVMQTSDNVVRKARKLMRRISFQTTIWMNSEPLDGFMNDTLDEHESEFWEDLIDKYLQPESTDGSYKECLKRSLTSLRNKTVIAYFLLNAICVYLCYIAENYLEQSQTDDYPDGAAPIPTACALMFGVLVFVQFICLIWKKVVSTIMNKLFAKGWEQYHSVRVISPNSAMKSFQRLKLSRERGKSQKKDYLLLNNNNHSQSSDVSDQSCVLASKDFRQNSVLLV